MQTLCPGGILFQALLTDRFREPDSAESDLRGSGEPIYDQL